MKIYVVGSHRKRFFKLDNIRQAFYVDEKHNGENIDEMNPWLCEMTGLYHLWKNNNDDIVGLEHYRRFLTLNNKTPMNETEINERLKTFDIICNKNNYPPHKNIRSWFINARKNEELSKFLIFAKVYVGKDYYDECINHLNGNWHVLGNIFYSKRELLNEYAEFIFDLTLKYTAAEKYFKRNLSPRILGYFTEFLFGAWLNWKKKNICFVNKKLIW